jgi:hypothetical protein
LIAVIVQERFYAALQTEIERYAEDVRHDLGATVSVVARAWSEPQDVRDFLRGLREDGLVGAVLIGDIPAAFFYAQLQDANLDRVPSDFYYMELDHELPLDSSGVFGRPAATVSLLPDIWVGRLTPSRDGETGIDQLRRYFDRNHAYRSGKLQAVSQMLVLDDMNAGQSQSSVEATDVERVMDRIGLYPQQTAVLPTMMSRPGRSKNDLKKVFQTPYEFAYMNHHGTPTTQQFGGEMITAADLLEIRPQPLFYFIWACSNGDYTSPGYLAGSYLYDGNGLVVMAPSVPVFGNIESGIPFLYPLSLGATFGQAHQYSNFLSPMALLGDPTLKIRRPPEPAAALALSQPELQFGQVPLVELEDGAMPLGGPSGPGSLEIQATNQGHGALAVNPVPSYMHFLYNGQWPQRIDNPMTFVLPERIEPGEEATLRFGMIPTQPGEYTGFVAFFTSDPHWPVVVLPFSAVAQGEAGSQNAPGEMPVDAPPRLGECTRTDAVLSLEGPTTAAVDQSISIQVAASPLAPLKQVEVRLDLSQGLHVVEGEVSWSGDLNASDVWRRQLVIAAAKPGSYLVQARLKGTTAEGTAVVDCQEQTINVD